MIETRARWGICATILIAAVAGCGETHSAAPDNTPGSASFALEGDAVARVHWLGKKRLGIDAGAYFFMRLWELPQTAALQAQTLDKLASAPWRGAAGAAVPAGAPVPELRSLLDDVVQQEGYIEIRHPAGQSGEAVYAIRLLDEGRARTWQTNLADVVQSLTHSPASAGADGRSWSIKTDAGARLIQLAREGTWTLVSDGQSGNLADEMIRRIRGDGTPVPLDATNTWLQIDAIPDRAVSVLFPAVNAWDGLSRVRFSVTGDGASIENTILIGLKHPPGISLEPWNIPTNLIRGPLASLTAARGFQALLESVPGISNRLAGIGPLPNQAYIWTGNRTPLEVCLAFPSPDARGLVDHLTDRLVGAGNDWLNAHSGGSFQRRPGGDGVTWSGIPMTAPYITAPADDPGWVFGELVPPDNTATNREVPAEKFHEFLTQSNLVYYNWEYTAPRLSTCLYLAQLMRIVSRHPQMAMDTPAALWVNALSPRLDNSTTTITLTDSNEFKFVRRSTDGLTALELNLLAGWLESPEFPFGWHKLP